MKIIARTYIGAIDLYSGVPDLEDGVVVAVVPHPDSTDYRTDIVIRDKKGNHHTITIAN